MSSSNKENLLELVVSYVINCDMANGKETIYNKLSVCELQWVQRLRELLNVVLLSWYSLFTCSHYAVMKIQEHCNLWFFFALSSIKTKT